MMLSKRDFHDYQKRAVNHQVSNPRSMLWLFCGSGKTAITLTTIAHLIKCNAIRGALVIAPLRVVQSVWKSESLKWEHTKHLTFSEITGNADRRMSALFKQADIHLVNYEMLPWLSAQLMTYFINKGQQTPFDMLVVDEISKMKNPATSRMEALSPLLHGFTYRTGLTGTPACTGYIDLQNQYKILDDGVRLGVDITSYKNSYFKPVGYGGYSYEIIENSNTTIEANIADITLEMNEDDYLNMPDFLVYDIHAQMPPNARKKYDRMEKELWTELDDGTELEVTSEVAKINKLLQMSNGAVYVDPETREWKKLHDAKLDTLSDILEEAGGNPVLCAYNYRTDAERIMNKFKFAVNLSNLKSKEFNQAIIDFAEGRIRLLIGHPGSMGHGTDGLQHGGNILVWFGCNFSLELTLQFNKRLHRQGQGKPVTCYRIICPNTMDEAVMARLEMRDTTQNELRLAINNYRKSRGM